MAIYHLSVKIGSRAKGQSAIAASAYRSGEKLTDKETGLTADYTRKGGIVHSEIALCANAPAEYADRQTLWNAVHEIEKAKDARLWREIEVALPRELSREEQIETIREFVKGLTEKGMCADWSLHDKEDGNPHAHIMLTTRSIEPSGKWSPKSRKVYDLDENGEKIFQKVDKSGRKQYKSHKEEYNDWNATERMEEWRSAWANCCNARLAEHDRIDHRSYERQGIEQIPTIHEGCTARKIVAKGGKSDLVSLNEEIREKNSLLKKIAEQLKAIGEELKQLITEQNREKGSIVNAGKQRIADLLSRRSRANNHVGGGIADREREENGENFPKGETDTDALIRQAETIGASAKADVADTRTTIEQSKSKVESSTASRADREAEWQRRAAEARRRAEEAERKAREESERDRTTSYYHSR